MISSSQMGFLGVLLCQAILVFVPLWWLLLCNPTPAAQCVDGPSRVPALIGVAGCTLTFCALLTYALVSHFVPDSSRQCWRKSYQERTMEGLNYLGVVWFVDHVEGQQWRCAICLSDSVEDGEKLCELDICNHVFHHGCIHKWFLGSARNLSKTNNIDPKDSKQILAKLQCPLCRSALSEPSTKGDD
jgi:hypothetical protein